MLTLCILSRSFLCTVCSKVSESLMLAMRILFCSCLYKVRSRVSDALSQALCNLSLAFVADFTLSDYNSFTLRVPYLRWRHTYCQWSIIELAKNVSPKNKIAASHMVQIHTHARFPRSKKWPTYHAAVPTRNALASQ